jgi:hypothetical protein
MKEYRRSFFSLIKGIIIAPFGGLAAAIVLHFFLSIFISYIVGGAITAILLYMAIFSENIRFELDGDGTFRYFKKGALRNTFNLPEYRIGYYAKTEAGVFYKTITTTYGPVKKELILEANKNYKLNFDRKAKLFTLAEI